LTIMLKSPFSSGCKGISMFFVKGLAGEVQNRFNELPFVVSGFEDLWMEKAPTVQEPRDGRILDGFDALSRKKKLQFLGDL
jgi:hypothetical protein